GGDSRGIEGSRRAARGADRHLDRMAIAPLNASFYADPASLKGLKRDAAAQSPQALREAARQFESLFTNMMLKSMRQASMGDPMFGSDQADMYQDMFDQQLAVQLGKG